MTTVPKRYESIRIILVLAIALAACAHIVTDPQGEDTSSDGPGVDTVSVCDPECPDGFECVDGMCHDTPQGTCGWYMPGHDQAGELCRIPAGSYHLGCNQGQDVCPSQCDDHCPACLANVKERVAVTFTADVFLDRFEVTNELYRQFLSENPDVGTPYCTDETDLWDGTLGVEEWLEQHPMVCVTAEEAQAFCAWAGKQVPTEAVWEVGARAGKLDAYPWGPCFGTHAAQCLYEYPEQPGSHNPDLYHCTNHYISEPCKPDTGSQRCDETAPVAIGEEPSRPHGSYGLVHMAGNAAEWVADGYKTGHGYGCLTGGCDQTSALVPPDGTRVVKGGSFLDDWDNITGWAREEIPEDARVRHIGFRCAVIPGLD